MIVQKRPEWYQSRREVQRRFPPGTFIVDSRGTRMALIVGWAPTRPEVNPRTGTVWRSQSWEAYLVEDCRLRTLPWQKVRESFTLEEWEAKLTDEAGA